MVFGIVVALFATVIYNAGFVLEKRALSDLPPISARHVGRLLRVLATSPRWLVGFGVLGVGLCCQILALSLIPLSVAQPIQISGLALLVVFSAVFLGERASRREWAGLGVLAASLVLIYLSLEPGRDKVGTSAHGWVMATLALGTVAVGITVFVVAGRRRRRPASGALYGAAAGLMYGVAGLQAKGMAGFFAQHLNDRTGGFVLQAITSPYPYLLVVMSGAGLVLFQTGLQRGRASIVVPVSNVVGSVYLIMTGTIAFGEPLPQDPMRLTFRLAGFVVATIIVVLLPTHEREAPVVRAKQLASAGS
ncbi:MAG TPA: DMT family transporter [Streptosporangiaceae bacterium]|nr:DMT family transporter [Streptosporangiaceae bacterium]